MGQSRPWGRQPAPFICFSIRIINSDNKSQFSPIKVKGPPQGASAGLRRGHQCCKDAAGQRAMKGCDLCGCSAPSRVGQGGSSLDP